MRVGMNAILPSIRELPVSLKLDQESKYRSPIKNSGYVINPDKYASEVKNVEINLKEIKVLLLMMVKGDSDFISRLIRRPNAGNYVNTLV